MDSPQAKKMLNMQFITEVAANDKTIRVNPGAVQWTAPALPVQWCEYQNLNTCFSPSIFTRHITPYFPSWSNVKFAA